MVGVHVLIGSARPSSPRSRSAPSSPSGPTSSTAPATGCRRARAARRPRRTAADARQAPAPARRPDRREPGPRRPPRPACMVGLLVAALSSPASSASTPQPAPTAWRRSPPTRASTRRPRTTPLDDSPLADYGIDGVGDARLSGGLAGVIGVGVTFARGQLVSSSSSRRRRADGADRGAANRRAREDFGRRRGRRQSRGRPDSERRPRARALPARGTPSVHRLPPHCKLAAVFCFVLVVVATPREAFWAFGLYALLLAAVAARGAGAGAASSLRRLLIEVPFVALRRAAALRRARAAGRGARAVAERVRACWAAWNILAKGTLGVVASILLAATTEPRDPAARPRSGCGCRRCSCRSRRSCCATATSSATRCARMRVARESRGFQGRGRPAAGVVCASRRARCSSAPTSAASGSTWPCSAAATPARCR